MTNLELLHKDLPYIYNLNNFLVRPEKYHPDNPKYQKQWNIYKKHCIEGLWAFDSYGWRFMPPTLFYYGNFFKMEDMEGKQRVIKKPMVRDIDWHIHYSYLEAMGFSGFKDDDKYTCDTALKDEEVLNLLKVSNSESDKLRYLNLFSNNGKYKEYADIREYLRMLHPDNKGLPLYYNLSKNIMIFGSRGTGKSYSVAGIICQTMTFDGLKEYTIKAVDSKPKVNISVGAGISDKSAELVSKIVKNFELHGTDPDFGAYGNPGDYDYIPGAFYIDWIGSTSPNNADNPYRYEYKVETANGWQVSGSGTKLLHINYSDKKQSGTQAAAGSRNALNVYEEIGLMPNFKDALLSNEATVSLDHEQFGVQFALGTSGNIDLVQQTKMVFNDPLTYNFLSYDNIWEETENKIGLFLPAYLSNQKFRDQNGNTNIEEALKFFERRRRNAAEKNDTEVLRNEKMNYPLVPSDMWDNKKGSYFPIAELLDHQKRLLATNEYKSGKVIDVIWSTSEKNSVKTVLDSEGEPYYFWPYSKTMSKPDGAIVIWEEPQEINGMIYNDQYFYVLDPYISENIDEGGSLGAFQVWLNPRYLKDTTHETLLVCSYYGKHPGGRDKLYEKIEKIIQKYGNCQRRLWYEANRGDSVRGFFIKAQKTQLLAIRPTREKGSSAKERNVTEFGFMVSNKLDKIDMCTNASDFLTQKFLFNGKLKMVLETIKDNFLIDQLIGFTLDGNFDAVSAFLGLPLALKEYEHELKREEQRNQKKNPLSFLSLNPNLFKTSKNAKYAGTSKYN